MKLPEIIHELQKGLGEYEVVTLAPNGELQRIVGVETRYNFSEPPQGTVTLILKTEPYVPPEANQR